MRSDSDGQMRNDYSSKAKDRPSITPIHGRRTEVPAYVSLSSRRRRKRRETVSSCRPYNGAISKLYK
jgi:hypothetical protein